MRGKKDVRIFFALWPDEKVRRDIVELFPRFDLATTRSRFLSPGNIHLTLHFIGNSSFEELKCLQRYARGVTRDSFILDIDRQGYFDKPKLLWIGCNQAPQALYELQLQLGRQLLPCGFIPEQRPFNPHVTIVRNLVSAPAKFEIEPISWKVDRFVLVESKPVSGGVQYQVIDEFPLNQPTSLTTCQLG